MFRFPRVLWFVAALAVVLASPSLFADFYSDDQGMVLSLEGIVTLAIPGPFHLYSFMSGAPGERDAFVAQGLLPWWSADGIRISFWRPLSSALMALDHALAGRNPLPYHVHTIAWYVAGVLAAAKLFQRLFPEREAALAALLFAASPAHWMLAAWPSARHVAISGTLAILALLLHVEARRRLDARAPLLSLAAIGCTVLALAGGETALGVFGYIAAYELVGRRDPIASRLRALLPWAALMLVYAVLYKSLGFGVRATDGYVDPIAQSAAYLSLLPSRVAVYSAAALLCVPSELSLLAPRALPILVGMGVAAAAAFAGLLRRALRVLGAESTRTHVWLLVGALLAVLPGAASLPGDRVLFLSNLAVAPALSTLLLHAGTRGNQGATGVSRVGVAFFGLVHVILAPLLFAFGASQLASTSHAAIAAAEKAEIPAAKALNVVGIGLSDPLIGMYLGSALYIAPRAEPRPRVVHLLTMSARDHRVTRTGDRTLEIAILNGTLLEGVFESLFRPASLPLHSGDLVSLGTWTVRVLEQIEGRPTRFSVLFDRPIDDPSIAMVVWKDGALRALVLPKVGDQVIVKHEPGPMGI